MKMCLTVQLRESACELPGTWGLGARRTAGSALSCPAGKRAPPPPRAPARPGSHRGASCGLRVSFPERPTGPWGAGGRLYGMGPTLQGLSRPLPLCRGHPEGPHRQRLRRPSLRTAVRQRPTEFTRTHLQAGHCTDRPREGTCAWTRTVPPQSTVCSESGPQGPRPWPPPGMKTRKQYRESSPAQGTGGLGGLWPGDPGRSVPGALSCLLEAPPVPVRSQLIGVGTQGSRRRSEGPPGAGHP